MIEILINETIFNFFASKRNGKKQNDKETTMQKKTLFSLFTLLISSLFAFSQVKIGVINSDQIMQESKRGKQALAKLENMNKSKQQNIQSIQNEIVKLRKELGSPALNTTTRQNKTQQLEDKQINLQRLVNDTKTEMQREMQKEFLAVNNEFIPIIHQIGKSKGFMLILDLNNSGVLYFDNSIDITAEVIKEADAKLTSKQP
jgi:outer membrane protein